MDAGGKISLFLAPSWMTGTWRVKGGLRALRVGFGDFALNPQEKITASKRPTLNYKNVFDLVNRNCYLLQDTIQTS
jgi:hypothetical protein